MRRAYYLARRLPPAMAMGMTVFASRAIFLIGAEVYDADSVEQAVCHDWVNSWDVLIDITPVQTGALFVPTHDDDYRFVPLPGLSPSMLLSNDQKDIINTFIWNRRA